MGAPLTNFETDQSKSIAQRSSTPVATALLLALTAVVLTGFGAAWLSLGLVAGFTLSGST